MGRRLRAALLVALLGLSGCLAPADGDDFGKAETLMAEGRMEEANEAWRVFIQNHPTSKLLPRALFNLATLNHLHLNRLDQAQAVYRRLVGLFPDHPLAPQALERLAELQLTALKDLPGAARIFQRLAESYSASTGRGDFYLERLAWIQLQMNQPDQARQSLLRLMRDHPTSPLAEGACFRLADSYYVRNQVGEALDRFRDCLRRWPGGRLQADLKFRLANCLEETGWLKEAREMYQELLKIHPNPEVVRIRLNSLEARYQRDFIKRAR